MTTKRIPALFLTLVTVAVAAVALTLTTGGGGSAAPAARTAPHPAAQAPSKAAAKPAAKPVARSAPARSAATGREGDSPAQMYLDDTDERRGQLIHTWDLCLLDHGARQDTGRAMAVFQGTGVKPIVVAEPIPAGAKAACEDKLPLLPKEENPGLNPDYVADSAANVACLRDHGIAVHTIADTSVYPDGLSWTYDSSTTPTPDDQAAIERACTIASFSD